jgi:hypothetical protein
MAGALLLGLGGEGGSPAMDVGGEVVPTGNTVMGMPPPPVTEEATAKGEVKKEKTGPCRPQAAARPMGNTTEAGVVCRAPDRGGRPHLLLTLAPSQARAGGRCQRWPRSSAFMVRPLGPV